MAEPRRRSLLRSIAISCVRALKRNRKWCQLSWWTLQHDETAELICGRSNTSTGSRMEAKTTTILLLLLAALDVTLLTGSHHGRSMPGAPSNISRDDPGLQRVVLAAAYSFNNQSNDAFLFKPSAIRRAQRQIVKGIRYIVDLEISRTVCRKRDGNNNLSHCDFQPPGRLQQVFQCHLEEWQIPWKHQSRTLELNCKP